MTAQLATSRSRRRVRELSGKAANESTSGFRYGGSGGGFVLSTTGAKDKEGPPQREDSPSSHSTLPLTSSLKGRNNRNIVAMARRALDIQENHAPHTIYAQFR